MHHPSSLLPARAESRGRITLVPTLLGVFASLAAVASAAETLGVLPDSGESIGMVGGHLANLTDASTVRRSPANMLAVSASDETGLSTYSGHQFLLNVSAWHGNVKFTPKGGLNDGQSVRIEDPWKFLASLYYVQPIKPGKVAFGLALSAPFGLNSVWPRDRDSALRYLVAYDALLLTVDLNPVVAFKITDQVTAAVGLNLMYSRLTLKQFYPWALVAQIAGARDGTLKYEADGFGISAFGGLRWDITPDQRLTLTGRLPIRVKYEGSFSASHIPDSPQTSGYEEHSDFETDATFPGSIAAGYGIDIGRLTLGVDFQWTWNSSHDDVPFRIGKKNQGLLLGEDALPLDWRDSLDVGVGASYRLDDSWVLRAGYLFSEWSQRSEFHTPAIPGSDRHLFSVGLGWQAGHHRVDAAYTYAYFTDRDITNNVRADFNGHYDVGWDVFTLSYGFRF